MKKILSIPAFIALCFLAGCSGNGGNDLYNTAASITAADSVSVNPLSWKVIASFTNKPLKTMSTLYGNEAAVVYARSGAGNTYPQGAIISLVTWSQQPDEHWFGARIPQQVQSVEVIRYRPAPNYEHYGGHPLRLKPQQDSIVAARLAFMGNERASVMP